MRSRITLAVLVAVLAVGALVVSPLLAGAQTPSPAEPEPESETGGREERAERFLDTFAEELGVTTEDLDAAFYAAVAEQLDQAVTDGELTREQADRLTERLADRDLADLLGGRAFGGFGRFGGHGGPRGLEGFRGFREFRGFRGAEEVTGEAAERASEVALAEVGDGEVVRVVRSDADGAEYFVGVRNSDGFSGVLLTEDFEVLRTEEWSRTRPDEGREDRDTSASPSEAA